MYSIISGRKLILCHIRNAYKYYKDFIIYLFVMHNVILFILYKYDARGGQKYIFIGPIYYEDEKLTVRNRYNNYIYAAN